MVAHSLARRRLEVEDRSYVGAQRDHVHTARGGSRLAVAVGRTVLVVVAGRATMNISQKPFAKTLMCLPDDM